MNTKIQLIETEVLQAGNQIRITDDLDIGYKHLMGVAILSSIGKGHVLRSFTLSGKELFPKNFEVEFLQSSNHVSPKERFFPLLEIADGKKIELEYIDSGTAETYPYTFKLYMLLADE
ncbi:hypothetical protein [Aquimarina algiphila]|uniref:Uncharacterized protein n=1 Tax=Aquimarina algiphila TaxID=2047982 RepID=A0A554VPE6_9FLAO|nr:hypothetical protein [Aquimarina algiphila]TSE10335.1 hypothetical protein FOF46_04690 [Aquimarina algiphila]